MITIGRRRFLVASAALAVGPVLGACSSSGKTGTVETSGATSGSGGPAEPSGAVSATGSGSSAGTGGVLPKYTAYNAITPDLAGTDEGVMPGYFTYPRDPKRAFSTPPAQGLNSISILTQTYTPTPTAMNKNAFWKELNKQVGATMDLSLIPAVDYAKKLTTIVASGDLPDVVEFPRGTANQPEILKSLFLDLSEYLSGDNVSGYPFLANFPTSAWVYGIANGTLYGVPQARALAGITTFYRKDIFAQRGVSPEPANYDEYVAMMRGVTDEKKNLWAFSTVSNTLQAVQMMLDAPNGWTVEDGKFTSAITDERTKQAIGAVATMVKDGFAHPDSFASSLTQNRTLYTGGRTATYMGGYAAWDLLAQTAGDNVAALVEPKHDGGGDASHFAGAGANATVSIKKGTSSDKVKKILAVLNWLAAPFGTEEYLFRKFGIEGTDFTWKAETPTLTDVGTSETALALQYVTDSPTILGPGPKERVTAQHDWDARVMKSIKLDASAGLNSMTQSTKGAALSKLVSDAQNDIYQGRKDLSSWDDVVKKWRSEGGDKIAEEYAAEYAGRPS
jgi:putative aldouronate transport system substrate-binding protein